MATGKKMSEYTPFSELSSEEKATYLENASVTTFGAKVSEGDNINVNIPLSTLVPSATDLAGDGLSVNGSTGKLDVSNKVPAPTATTDRGKVLTVNNSDEVVWDTPASSTYVKEDKGLTASGSYIGVECAGTGGLITDANGLYIKHDTNDKGKFLTVGDDNEITWGTPSGGSTNVIGGSDGAIYGSGAYCYVRTDENTIVVNSQNQLHANFNIIDGSGGVIDVQHGDGIHIVIGTDGANTGDVLTVNQNGDASWAAPQGGTDLPQYDSSHEGMVLTVGYLGEDLSWKAPLPVYDEGYDGKILSVKVRETQGGDEVAETAWIDPPTELPDTTGHSTGDVLSIGADNEITWGTPSGGGGGGNPYTKATVTPGDCYLNGKISASDFPLYDQDVTISNNTYSILPNPIGWYPDWTDEHEEWHPAHNLDNLVIKLPSNTEFPMAVVEFTIRDDDNYSYWGCVNNIKVKVGETELTRMYAAPYNPNTLLMNGEHNDQFQYWKLVTVPNEGNPYYRVEEVFNANRGADISAFAHGTKVQVQIFGSCFNVTMSQVCGEPAAS